MREALNIFKKQPLRHSIHKAKLHLMDNEKFISQMMHKHSFMTHR